jgi:sulfite reductase alpha subunit-like flavoprotein
MANTGDGDPPDNAILFWKWIQSASPGLLNGVSVALLGLYIRLDVRTL